MENATIKFEKENEVLKIKYLLAKDANCTIIWKRLIIVSLAMAPLIIISFFLYYLEKVSQGRAITIILSLIAVWLFLYLAINTLLPQNLRFMYADLNSKAKEFVKNEILPNFLSSLLKKGFVLNKDFEKNLLSLIENQRNWIRSDGGLIYYQSIDDKSLLMTKNGITYYLLFWRCSAISYFYPEYGSKLICVENNSDFLWYMSILSIEESDDSTLISK